MLSEWKHQDIIHVGGKTSNRGIRCQSNHNRSGRTKVGTSNFNTTIGHPVVLIQSGPKVIILTLLAELSKIRIV